MPHDYEQLEDADLQFWLNLWMFSRHLKAATGFLKEKKIQSGLKATVTNLAEVGLKVTGLVLTTGGTELLGVGTAAAHAGIGSGATVGALSADGIAVPVSTNVAGMAKSQIGRVERADSFSQFQNRKTKQSLASKAKGAAKEGVKGVLMINQLQSAFAGLKQIGQKRQEWDAQKRDVISSMRPILTKVDELIVEHTRVIEVTWKGSKVPLKKKTVMSDQIRRKYYQRDREFANVAGAYELRKRGRVPLLGGMQSDD